MPFFGTTLTNWCGQYIVGIMEFMKLSALEESFMKVFRQNQFASIDPLAPRKDSVRVPQTWYPRQRLSAVTTLG